LDTLGKRIRAARKRIKINQAQLAHLAGTTQQTISNYERDQRISHADLNVLIRIAKACCVTTDYLLIGELPDKYCKHCGQKLN
jgi:transcriptional regulator with XRE-family HTH domain